MYSSSLGIWAPRLFSACQQFLDIGAWNSAMGNFYTGYLFLRSFACPDKGRLKFL